MTAEEALRLLGELEEIAPVSNQVNVSPDWAEKARRIIFRLQAGAPGPSGVVQEKGKSLSSSFAELSGRGPADLDRARQLVTSIHHDLSILRSIVKRADSKQ